MNSLPIGDDGFSPGGQSVASAGHISSINTHHIDDVKAESELMSNDGASTAASPAELGATGKKRKIVSGSRGVAHLTPEQLAKKRANDREAQRAIRERTKNTIEALQHKIHELTNMDHMLELQKAQQAREFVERENADIKRRLITIMEMLQPLVHAHLEPQPCIPPNTQAYAPSITVQSTAALSYNSPSTTHSASPAASLQQQHIHQPPAQAWQASRNITPIQTHQPGPLDEYTRTQLEAQRHSLQHTFEMGQERLNLNYVLSHDNHGRTLAGVPKIERGVNGAQDSPAYHHVPLKHDWTQVSHVGQAEDACRAGHPPHPGQVGHNMPLPNRPSPWEASSRFDQSSQAMSAPPMTSTLPMPTHHEHALAVQSPGYIRQDGIGPALNPYMGIHRGLIPPYAMPTNNCSPTCPLDSLLLDCINERRQRHNEGLEPHKVAGPQYPSVSSLLNPENARYSHPLSKFFTDILAKFPDVSTLPERVGVLYVMFIYMRWQVLLSPDTFGQLPEWMIPRSCQITKPHPIWIDYLPFPEMRERLVQMYDPVEFSFDNFFVPYTRTLVLSWPYEGTDTLLQDPASDEVMINPVFYRHLRNLDNWKLVGPDFAQAFPKLVGSYNRGL